MVKVWIHKPGGIEPFLVTEISVHDCATQFDLQEARFLQPLGERPLTAAAPGPLGADPNPELVFTVPLEPGDNVILFADAETIPHHEKIF